MDIKKLLTAMGTDVIMLLLIGGFILYSSASDMVVSFKPAISFEDMLNGTEVKAGSHVEGDVIYVLDYFASESTYTQYNDGSRSADRASGNYYLIPTYDSFIGLKSRQVDVADFNKLSDETFEYLTSGTEPTTKIFMQGSVKAMDDKVAKYYREYLEEMGYAEAEITAMGEPLVMEFVSFNAVRIMFIIGVVLIALALFFWRRRYQRELKGSGLKKAEDLPDTP